MIDRVTADLREYELHQVEFDKIYSLYGEEARAEFFSSLISDPRWIMQCVIDGEWMTELANVAHAAVFTIRPGQLDEAEDKLAAAVRATAQQHVEADADEIDRRIWDLHKAKELGD